MGQHSFQLVVNCVRAKQLKAVSMLLLLSSRLPNDSAEVLAVWRKIPAAQSQHSSPPDGSHACIPARLLGTGRSSGSVGTAPSCLALAHVQGKPPATDTQAEGIWPMLDQSQVVPACGLKWLPDAALEFKKILQFYSEYNLYKLSFIILMYSRPFILAGLLS